MLGPYLNYQSRYIHCVQKKNKMFCVISPTKLRRFWRKLAHSFLNKCAAKLCKRFPPHLNNVSALPCETWNAHCTHTTIELLQRKTQEFISPQLCFPNSPDLNPVDNGMWEILQKKVYKTRIADLELSTMPLMNDCCKWRMIQLGQLRSQSLFQFVQISDAYFIHLLLQYSYTL